MAKAYWIVFYRSISDPAALSEYAKRGGAVIQSGGGRFIVRGMPAKTVEAGINQRTVVIEFDSLDQALATYNHPEYQAAYRLLEGKVDRDVRFVEGVG